MFSVSYLLAQHWKLVLSLGTIAALVIYIAFLSNTIDNDHKMLDVAHDQMAKLSAEYRADVEQMTASITQQNLQIEKLQSANEISTASLEEANKRLVTIRTMTNTQVNAILAQLRPVSCESSIKYAIDGVKELTWDTAR